MKLAILRANANATRMRRQTSKGISDALRQNPIGIVLVAQFCRPFGKDTSCLITCIFHGGIDRIVHLVDQTVGLIAQECSSAFSLLRIEEIGYPRPYSKSSQCCF